MTNVAWVLLVAAGMLEVAFTYSLKRAVVAHSPRWYPLFLLAAAGSFWLLAMAAQLIPVGTAYAVWAGLGAAGTAFIGWVAFCERMPPVKCAVLVVLIAAVVGLRLAS